MQKRDIREYRFPPYRHFERKREIFFVRSQAKDARTTDNGNSMLHMNGKLQCFMKTDSHRKEESLKAEMISSYGLGASSD